LPRRVVEEELHIAGGLNPMGRPKPINNCGSAHANPNCAIDQVAGPVHWQNLLGALTSRKYGQHCNHQSDTLYAHRARPT
jgi:hypothetical protein